eukprot:6326453-Amphidinium_carterae.3
MAPILNKVLPALITSGLLLIATKKLGKIALASILAMAYSRRHIKLDDKHMKLGFRLTQELDLRKGRDCTLYEPVIFDDGDLHLHSPKLLKAFLNLRAPLATTIARWTCTRFLGALDLSALRATIPMTRPSSSISIHTI